MKALMSGEEVLCKSIGYKGQYYKLTVYVVSPYKSKANKGKYFLKYDRDYSPPLHQTKKDKITADAYRLRWVAEGKWVQDGDWYVVDKAYILEGVI